jgi:hypothetical protein
MAEIVGVRALGLPTKQEVLLFDRIISFQPRTNPELGATLDFLEQHRLISSAKFYETVQEALANASMMPKKMPSGLAQKIFGTAMSLAIETLRQGKEIGSHLKEYIAVVERAAQDPTFQHQYLDAITRYACLFWEEKGGSNVCGILDKFEVNSPNLRRSLVADILLRKMPTPLDTTPWEQIVEYKADSISRAKALALRRWINKIATDSTLPFSEIEDEIEYLIHEYTETMKIHNMKYRLGFWRTLITVSVEIVGGITWLNLKNTVDGIFSVTDRKLALAEAELKAPGRELSYVVRTTDQFTARA